jgi:hypothetical protein
MKKKFILSQILVQIKVILMRARHPNCGKTLRAHNTTSF